MEIRCSFSGSVEYKIWDFTSVDYNVNLSSVSPWASASFFGIFFFFFFKYRVKFKCTTQYNVVRNG